MSTYKRIMAFCDKHHVYYCPYENCNKLEFGFDDGYSNVTIEFLEYGYKIKTPLSSIDVKDDVYPIHLEAKTTKYSKETYVVLTVEFGVSLTYTVTLWSYEV